MQRTLLSLAAVSAVAASLSAQICVQPNSFETPFASTHFSGAPSLDPGPAVCFDLHVTAGLTINNIAVNFLNDGGTFGTPPQTRPLLNGTQCKVELWLINTTGGLNGGSVIAGTNLNRTYLHNPTTLPGGPWNASGPDAIANVTIAPFDTLSIGPVISPAGGLHLNAGDYGCVLVMVPAGTTFGTPGTTDSGAGRLHPLITLHANAGDSIGDQIMTLTTRGFQGTAFAAPGNAAFMPDVHFDYTLDANTAYSTQYGHGCVDKPQTFYEGFAATNVPGGSTIDIVPTGSNVLLTMIPVTNLGGDVTNYIVGSSTTTYPTITPNSTTWYTTSSAGATPTHVNTVTPGQSLWGDWDDSISLLYPLPFASAIRYAGDGGVGATGVAVGSNGAIWFDSTTGDPRFAGPTTQYQQWIDGPASFAVGYMDLWPHDGAIPANGGTGEIYIDSDATNATNGTYVAISWVGVTEYPNGANTGSNNNYQIIIYADGHVDMVYNRVSHSNSGVLVGFTPGFSAVDPGANQTLNGSRQAPDLSAVLPVYVSGDGKTPAILSPLNRPQTTGGAHLSYETTNTDPSVVFDILFLTAAGFNSTVPGGFNDLAGIGMENGCFLLADIFTAPGIIVQHLNIAGTGPNGGFLHDLGNLTGQPSVQLYAQSLQLSSAPPGTFNSLNWMVSNGVCSQLRPN